MADQISAKEYSMWDLMSGKFIFNIPDYQRPYSWTENEAVTLWDDLVEFWHESKLNTDQSYFVGSIVLVKKSDSPQAEVIDGQQRLTTTFLTLYAVRSIFKEDGANEQVQQLEGQYLTNPFHKEKIKYRFI